MATRIEKSRPTKRPQAAFSFSTGGQTLTGVGKLPRLDERGFPTTNGVDITRAAYSVVA